MKIDRERIKFILASDLILKGPLWALLILAIWGGIAYAVFWVVLNIIKPSIDKRKAHPQQTAYIMQNNINALTKNN